MNTTIVIVNWNGLKFLKTLFDSINSQTLPRDEFEVIVVDNNSSDDSVAYLKENHPAVSIIEYHKNSGFAEGCNVGIRHAQGKYIVLINNDMGLHKDWLKKLVETADKSDDNVGAVVSKVVFKNKKGYINNVGSNLHPTSDWPITDRGYMEKDTGQYEKLEEVSAFCGASVLLKRTMLQDIGLFDHTYFMYFEDADMSWRGTKKGWKYLYEPRSIALHEHAGSSKEGSDFFVFQVMRNRMIILLKHGTKKAFISAVRQTLKDRLIFPSKRFIRHEGSRRQALHECSLGIKILVSFAIRIPNAIIKRYGIAQEKKI